MVESLEEATSLYTRTLGTKVCHSEDLNQYSLRNAIMPTGEGTFVELLQPTDPQSAGGRFLQRKGEGMYLLTLETQDYESLIADFNGKGIRITDQVQQDNYRSFFVHPGSMNGVFMEFVEASRQTNPWPPAGENWYTQEWSPITRQLQLVAVLVNDLDSAMSRWEDVFGLPFTNRSVLEFTDLEIAIMPLADKRTFIELAQPTSSDGRAARYLERHGEGLYLLIFRVADVAAAEAHLRDQAVRITTAVETPGYIPHGITSVWIHPRAMKGVFTQMSEVLSVDNPWPPAGESWYSG